LFLEIFNCSVNNKKNCTCTTAAVRCMSHTSVWRSSKSDCGSLTVIGAGRGKFVDRRRAEELGARGEEDLLVCESERTDCEGR
jgi:hypothetical protein